MGGPTAEGEMTAITTYDTDGWVGRMQHRKNNDDDDIRLHGIKLEPIRFKTGALEANNHKTTRTSNALMPPSPRRHAKPKPIIASTCTTPYAYPQPSAV
jgi:hypothetical protein